MIFTTASTIDEALSALNEGARPIAGGTDLVVGARGGKAPLPERLVAIDRIPELATIATSDDGTRIGSLVTHATLMTDAHVAATCAALADAAALVGSPSTRNVGTLGGNVMNASPAMDTGAPLIVLGAQVELRSPGGVRTVDPEDLWTGPGATSASPDELCTALVVPDPQPRSGSAYVRLEYRRAMEIAVVGAAAAVALDDHGNVASARVALAAVAPTVVEVDDLDPIIGTTPTEAAGLVASLASAQCAPISDVRASDAYRRHCVGVMAGRALDAAARRAAGEHIAVPVNRALGIGAA